MKLSSQKNLRPLVAPWLLAMLVACILPSTRIWREPWGPVQAPGRRISK